MLRTKHLRSRANFHAKQVVSSPKKIISPIHGLVLYRAVHGTEAGLLTSARVFRTLNYQRNLQSFLCVGANAVMFCIIPELLETGLWRRWTQSGTGWKSDKFIPNSSLKFFHSVEKNDSHCPFCGDDKWREAPCNFFQRVASLLTGVKSKRERAHWYACPVLFLRAAREEEKLQRAAALGPPVVVNTWSWNDCVEYYIAEPCFMYHNDLPSNSLRRSFWGVRNLVTEIWHAQNKISSLSLRILEQVSLKGRREFRSKHLHLFLFINSMLFSDPSYRLYLLFYIGWARRATFWYLNFTLFRDSTFFKVFLLCQLITYENTCAIDVYNITIV